jgi:hypothetical protein
MGILWGFSLRLPWRRGAYQQVWWRGRKRLNFWKFWVIVLTRILADPPVIVWVSNTDGYCARLPRVSRAPDPRMSSVCGR